MSGQSQAVLVAVAPQVFTEIRKRDGRVAPFNGEKITRAILKAGRATDEFAEAEARRLTIRVLSLAQTVLADPIPLIEDVQDLVEEVLLASPYKKTAKAYILYRDQHSRIREMVKKADLDLIDSYLEKLDWQVEENSNMSYSLQGLNNYVASEISKVYWLNKIYTQDIRRAHQEGDIHIHDLGQLSVYCVGWDLQDLLRQGFKGAAGKAESAPAKHLRSALGQVVNFFYTLQGEAAGAQAFSSFDTLLAPFIRHDNLDYKQVKQAIQEFVFNLNVPTRVGFQTPFTNLTFDLQPPKNMENLPVLIGGKDMGTVYGDYQEEMNLFNQAFLKVMSEGDAKGRVFTFPIPTYNITKDFNWDDPGLTPLWEVTSRYGIAYFSNFVNSDLSPDDARSMCCRLRLDTRQLEKRGGGLFGANPLTGSIGVVTINMGAIGYQAGDEKEFFLNLKNLMELARTSLETKRKVLEQFTAKGLYPYTSYYLHQIRERYDRYWENHFSTIGLIGMNEACLNLLGVGIGEEPGKEFALKVLDYMRARLIIFQEETGNNYNLEATPAEGTGFRLARLDAKRFSDLKYSLHTTGDGDKKIPVYSNSTQLPVDFSDDIFEVLDLQDDLQSKYTGGTVQHVFLGESAADPMAVKAFIKKVCDDYRLPYFTITPSFSICPDHGYIRGEEPVCPDCGNRAEMYSRVVGYLRPVDQWNSSKRDEFAHRARFKVVR